MLVIDGSTLEGGGQVVRSAVTLSAITGQPCRITNIRAGRKEPGLRSQHIAAVRAVAGLCGAVVSGCTAGSRELTFCPGPLVECDIRIEVGTAGSIPLVLQAWLPAAMMIGGGITVVGGTEVPRSPTIDYTARVLVPFLRQHGAEISLDVIRRGYFPRGGGEAVAKVRRSRLAPFSPEDTRETDSCGIVSCSAGLPGHVAERQADAASSALFQATGIRFPVWKDTRPGPGTGSSVTVWMGWMAGSAIGRRGYLAENVGRDAVVALLAEHHAGGLVDRYLADQILIYCACAGGSFTSSTCTLHARTMCWLLGLFGFRIRVTEGEVVTFAAEEST